MSDANDADDAEAIRERKRRELERRARTDDGSGDAPADAGAGSPGEPVHVTGADHLSELLADNEVVLVDFYADWCGPCKMLEPTVEAVARETDAAVAKVDVDAHQQLAGRYQVQGVPTLYLFADGEPVERMVGVQDRATLTGLVDEHLA